MTKTGHSASYKSINLSYKKKLVFRLGADSGFFSEFNNMVFAILFCLKYKIRFTLSSRNSTLFNTGWSEYFVPFCPEDNGLFHLKNNFRTHFRASNKRHSFIKLYCIITGNYLTQNVWEKFHSPSFTNEEFNFESLGITGNTLTAAREVIGITWKYNASINKEIKGYVNRLSLPANYSSVHIRRGDKEKEVDNTPIELYINLLTYTQTNIFVATDDYTVITELKSQYPNHTFYHLTDPEETGYQQTDFNKVNASEKHKQLIKLFATIEILCNSDKVAGTYSSNIGMYLGMRMAKGKFIDVNFDEWHIV